MALAFQPSSGHRPEEYRASAPVTTFLERLQAEMEVLACGAATIQDALGPFLAALPFDSGVIREAQRLDLIEQTLRDLSEVIARAARWEGDPERLNMEALVRGCRLEGLASRLRQDAPDLEERDGDLDLF